MLFNGGYMIRNLKLTYILLAVFTSITMAFKTLTNFFGGVGLNFVAMLAIAFVIMLLALKDSHVAKNCWDMYILSGILLILEFVMYFACEYGNGLFIKGFWIYQNVIAFLGFLVLAYICFRFTLEFLNKKLRFIEIMLGNEKRVKKEKKAKEITNGSLLEKPNHKEEAKENKETTVGNTTENETQDEPTSNEESPIVVETEE